MIVHLSIEGLVILQMIVASVLPTLVAVVTKSHASSAVKTWTLVVLAIVTDLLTSVLAQNDFEVKQFVLSFFGMLFAAIAAHYGVTSNIGLSGSDSHPASLIPNGLIPVGKNSGDSPSSESSRGA